MVEVFYIGSIFCALITVYLLLFKEKALRTYSDTLLALLFLFEVWCVVIYLAISYGWIVNTPHLYKTAAPINYLLPPLTYLYIRAVLFNEKKLSTNDIWHFIPFVLFFLNYIPFYILPVIEKSMIVQSAIKKHSTIYQYQVGIVPESVSFIVRLLLTIIYLIFQWRLIFQFKIEKINIEFDKQIKEVLKWLKIFTWIRTFIIITLLSITLLVLFKNPTFSFSFMNLIHGFIISICFLVISSYLLLNPTVLMGFPFIKYTEVDLCLLINKKVKLPFVIVDYAKEIEQLKTYFNENQPYLIKGVNINDVAVGTGIPAKELSFIINQHFKQRFNEFVNQYRISYITKKINEGYLDHYTLQTLSSEAGFTSPTTFIAAFKKIELCSPSEYLLNNKDKD
jgi:AraC-like DNA-binding protein